MIISAQGEIINPSSSVTSGSIHDASVGSAGSSRQVPVMSDKMRMAIYQGLQKFVEGQNENKDLNNWLRA
jgi:hypothetical protein